MQTDVSSAARRQRGIDLHQPALLVKCCDHLNPKPERWSEVGGVRVHAPRVFRIDGCRRRKHREASDATQLVCLGNERGGDSGASEAVRH